MVKLTTVVDGQEVVIEGTVEEIKAFQEDNTTKESNVTSDLLSPKERLDIDESDNFKVGDIVRFTEDSGVELEARGIHSLFLPNKEMKKGQYALINQKVNNNKELIVDIEGQPYEIKLSKVKDIIEKVGELGEENPLNLQKGQDYLIHNYDGESYDEIMTLENIDGVSYLFTSEEERLFVPYRKKDELLFSDISEDDDDIEPVVKVVEGNDLEVGEYYEVPFLHCDYSSDILKGKVKLKEIEDDGDYTFINEDGSVDCIVKEENLVNYTFNKIEENEEQESNEEEPEENQTEFKEGNIVEVVDDSFGGVEEGNYGIITECREYGNFSVAGYSSSGEFSKSWVHTKKQLKLIKE